LLFEEWTSGHNRNKRDAVSAFAGKGIPPTQASSGWKLNETSIKVKGSWKYLYWVVDKEGKTIDFKAAALRFF
jgi:transposase-like protein